MFTALLAYVVCLLFCSFVSLFFFACFVVRDLCRSGCKQNYYLKQNCQRTLTRAKT